MQTGRRARPATVTIAFGVTLIQAVTSLLSGSLLVAASRVAASSESLRIIGSTLAWYGVGFLLLGAITIAVALGLRTGSGAARLYLTATMIVSVMLASLGWAAFGLRGHLAAAVIGIGLAAAVLVLVWNRRADAYFRSN